MTPEDARYMLLLRTLAAAMLELLNEEIVMERIGCDPDGLRAAAQLRDELWLIRKKVESAWVWTNSAMRVKAMRRGSQSAWRAIMRAAGNGVNVAGRLADLLEAADRASVPCEESGSGI